MRSRDRFKLLAKCHEPVSLVDRIQQRRESKPQNPRVLTFRKGASPAVVLALMSVGALSRLLRQVAKASVRAFKHMFT